MTSENERLLERCEQMTFTLGTTFGGLGEIISNFDTSLNTKQSLHNLHEYLCARLNELYYPESKVQRPPQVSKAYKREWKPVCRICNGDHGCDGVSCLPLNCS
jgi:hypothetical protein